MENTEKNISKVAEAVEEFLEAFDKRIVLLS